MKSNLQSSVEKYNLSCTTLPDHILLINDVIKKERQHSMQSGPIRPIRVGIKPRMEWNEINWDPRQFIFSFKNLVRLLTIILHHLIV